MIYETLGELTPSLFWWCSKAQIYSDENQYICFLFLYSVKIYGDQNWYLISKLIYHLYVLSTAMR